MVWFWWIYGCSIAAAMLLIVVDLARGIGLVPDLTKPQWDAWPKGSHPRVSVIVPARNEGEGIGACLGSLAAQDYDNLEIIAVNDRSTDGTGAVMQQMTAMTPNLRVVTIAELPPGWLGKTHAMWTAAKVARGDWLLFTDGDIMLREDTIRRAVIFVESARADHLVIVPTMICRKVAERMVVALFFQMAVAGTRIWKFPDPRSRSGGGAGAFNMVRRSAYEAIGTMEAIRLAVLEDVTLGFRVKAAGFTSYAAFGRGMVTLQYGRGLLGMINNVTKNMFAALQYRWYLALAVVVLIFIVHLAPFAALWLAPRWARLPFAFGLLGILAVYVILGRVNGISPAYFFLHPLNALLMIYAVLKSTAVTLWNGGVVWRGTLYPLDELRRAMTWRHPRNRG
ncbi:MAG: glycosyltransferase family 2 protein [Acidobacteriia bacterium]|nr:glycosyltransferase family 2 protein [Terriglobia bacterium]